VGSIPHPDTVFCYFSSFNRRAWPFNGPARHDYQAAVPGLRHAGRPGTARLSIVPNGPVPCRAGLPVWASITTTGFQLFPAL
jgi:hypothetical protein